MGQHALAYVLLAYVAASLSRRILWFPLGSRRCTSCRCCCWCRSCSLVCAPCRAPTSRLGYFVGPLVGTLLWFPLTFVLLLPQYQPVDRDANRPI
jgi:rod shape-determining protein MreD